MTSVDHAGGDHGEVSYGWDYWFNWSIWTAPAALAKPGGFADRILAAGKRA
jgi:hypothetical protein